MQHRNECADHKGRSLTGLDFSMSKDQFEHYAPADHDCGLEASGLHKKQFNVVYDHLLAEYLIVVFVSQNFHTVIEGTAERLLRCAFYKVRAARNILIIAISRR